MAAHSTKHQTSYEYLLMGGIPEGQLDSLLNRLRGLCDHNHLLEFSDREILYGLKSGNAVVQLRVRQSLSSPSAPWHLLYCGQLDGGGEHRPTALRNLVTVPCSHSLLLFLDEMGFTPQIEMVLKGYIFKKGPMKVTLSKLYQVPESGELAKVEQFSDHYVVELSAVSSSGQDAIAAELKAFADQLKPIVYLHKLDHTLK